VCLLRSARLRLKLPLNLGSWCAAAAYAWVSSYGVWLHMHGPVVYGYACMGLWCMAAHAWACGVWRRTHGPVVYGCACMGLWCMAAPLSMRGPVVYGCACRGLLSGMVAVLVGRRARMVHASAQPLLHAAGGPYLPFRPILINCSCVILTRLNGLRN